ncbi:MAG TPA: hypothetical protein VMK05_00785 [Burkholderiales bacterium]|nr:hypothetical protein [Burkholderiales bacterium]
MAKSYDQRIDDTVAVIDDICGSVDARTIKAILAGKTAQELKTLSESISIGYFGSSGNADVKRLRAVKRAIVLSSKLLPGAQAVGFDALDNLGFIAAAEKLRKLFPFRARPILGNFDGRLDWEFSCTDPAKHDKANFRYIVHGIMAAASRVAQYTEIGGKVTQDSEKAEYDKAKQKFSGNPDMLVETATGGGSMKTFNLNAKFFVQYLKTPEVLKTVIISTSLIDQDHVASYYPFGFVLDVPAVNIYGASGQDQGVANRTDDILAEFQRIFDVGAVGNRILSPKQVLDNTNQSQGKTGYNEVVVVGTSPEGRHVSVNGIFVKVDASGNLWVDPAQKTPYVTVEIAQLVNELTESRGLPIVAILDTAGGTATNPVRADGYFSRILGL